MKIDEKLDLVLTKVLDIRVELVWKAWTTPELYGQWFCPLPWKVVEAEIDLRPGGIYRFVMQTPEGQKIPNLGCILEVVPQKKFVWTNSLFPDFRPRTPVNDEMQFTAEIILEAQGDKTKYTAIGRHGNEEDRMKHEEMGFQTGWGICADQLVKLMKGL